MTQTFEEFQKAFRVPELTVYTNTSWTWSVRPQQPTLGASVVSLNRFAERLSDITEQEGNDLRDVFQKVERAIGAAFGYTKINYLMLMMVDAHVHYHVIPRYDGRKTFEGRDFPDQGWPKFPDLTSDHAATNGGIATQIAAHLAQAVDVT